METTGVDYEHKTSAIMFGASAIAYHCISLNENRHQFYSTLWPENSILSSLKNGF